MFFMDSFVIICVPAIVSQVSSPTPTSVSKIRSPFYSFKFKYSVLTLMNELQVSV